MRGTVAFQCGAGQVLRQPFGAGVDAKAAQEGALRGVEMRLMPRERLEVYMGGQVSLAGMREGVVELMSAQRLQRVTARPPAAVVDDQSKTPVVVQPVVSTVAAASDAP